MKYGFCHLSVIPGRLDPSDPSEMITQVLFGDHFKVIEERAKWVKIRNAFDKYESWIDRKQLFEISKEEYTLIDEEKYPKLSSELVGVIRNEDDEIVPILLGATLPGINDDLSFEVQGKSFVFDGSISTTKKNELKVRLIENAYMFMNAPYLWGGKTPFGIDCSGLSQMVYKLNGIHLPRDAYQQAEKGITLSFVEEAEPGDLAFFDDAEGNITHVGILLENNLIIHASGKVRVDPIDHQGIFNKELNNYSHKLRLIKKIIK